jgi:two-component system chemotaxis sensor kinase CheA
VLSVLVLRSGTRRIAIAVDAFLDQCEAVVKDLGRLAGASPKVLGGILLADGAVAVVLNPAELVTTSRNTDRPLNLAERKEAPERTQPTILVVDDSLTTRTLEKSILEGQGYRVRLAVDGLDALRQLRLEPPALVVTDLQMPRLDGYELVAEMKKDQQLAGIPVIVVTSLEKAEDRERGLGLGVDAYVVKKKFDQRELLDVIRQIL